MEADENDAENKIECTLNFALGIELYRNRMAQEW